VKLEGQKIISAREMARIEKKSIEAGASSERYMLKAGEGIASHVEAFMQKHQEKEITLLVGKGNNGGDAFVAGALLLKKGYTVHAYHLFKTEESSSLCQKYEKAFKQASGTVTFPSKTTDITLAGVILDGLLGTGFQGEVKGLLLDVIELANASKCPVISIDIPSGVDGNTGQASPTAIEATETIFLGLPKIGFFLNGGYNFIGALRSVDFGIEATYLDEAKTSAAFLNKVALQPLLPPLTRTRHKYQAGYLLAVAGSPGMAGAAMLTSLAALRTGAGIVRLFHPFGMESEFLRAPYEIIRTPYKKEIAPILLEMKRAAACLIGPGLGKETNLTTFLKKLFSKITVPTVIDADGLFHLKEVIDHPSFPCVLTPHHQEMLRLLDKTQFDDVLAECQTFVNERQVTLALKGAPTFIFHPHEVPLVIARGDPGMATAGTGDVLTGMIGALLAQKLKPRAAAALGVYLHARAGELVARAHTSYDLIASDLLEALPEVFKEIIQID